MKVDESGPTCGIYLDIPWSKLLLMSQCLWFDALTGVSLSLHILGLMISSIYLL